MEMVLFFSPPTWPFILYCHRKGSLFSPHFLNTRNLKCSLLTHLWSGSAIYMSQVTCSGKRKWRRSFETTVWADESHRTNQPKQRAISVSQQASRTHSSFTLPASEQDDILGCYYAVVSFASKLIHISSISCKEFFNTQCFFSALHTKHWFFSSPPGKIIFN